MAQAKRNENGAVKTSQVVDRDEHQKKPRKVETYLVTLPTAEKKFADTPDMKKSDPQYNDSSEGPFGLGPLVFPCLQRFNNVKFFLALLFLAVMAHAMIFALVELTLKVFESHLSPSRTEAFVMDSSDYITACLFSLIVAHFGGRGNRANWVAVGCFLTGISAIVFAIPFINFEIIKLSVVKEELCEEGKKPKFCDPTVIPHKSVCIFIFIFGQFLHGIAGLPLYVLGASYIYDHIPTNTSGLYIGLIDFAVGVGYSLGFIGGMQTFKIPVQEAMQAVGHVQRIQILQRGWWRPFIFVAVFAFCTTLPLFCFPSSLPGAHQIRLAKSQEPPTFDRRLKNKEIKNNLKSVLHAIW
ncbi:solute carrier organic anion transporter family member 6A1-like, partial [Mus pahari]|uniref:solute carrier organic anion transporter family member 6A1-like n=1 Tax=Mus pahari TaxID=10093 RepID=UPI000A3065C7